MGAFLGISLWVALATVVPGLVTISTFYVALVFINPKFLNSVNSYASNNDWVIASIAVTIMILTQAIGILLEKFIIDNKKFKYTDKETSLSLEEGIIPEGVLKDPYSPYNEYRGLYLLIAELSEHEDSQGHLKRALAQFFLTNNTLVSFSLGMLLGIVILILSFFSIPETYNVNILINFAIFEIIMFVCNIISYKVAKIRFNVMGKILLATRIAHIEFKAKD